MSAAGIEKLAAAIAPKVALLELADRCETAVADRDIDRRISIACGYAARNVLGQVVYTHGKPSGSLSPRRYTASLDAALTLVPEGWPVRDLSQWRSQKSDLDDSVSDEHWTVALDWPDRKYCQVDGMGATAPLAICAAALKARAAQNTTQGKANG